MNIAVIIFLSVCLDIILGWPKIFLRNIGHPVIWIGKLITTFDTFLNQERFSSFLRSFFGILTLFILISFTVTLSILIEKIIFKYNYGSIFLVILIWPLLAINSMYFHVKDVANKLMINDLEGARYATSKIVSRETKSLNEYELTRASLESLSENTSDGVTAPIFWGLLLGLPGIVGYKVINTLDSMIGYKNKKYNDFGWASAKIDDIVNYLPARITALIFLLFSNNIIHNFKNILEDASKHKSPNAGWPEAAFAYTLNVKLSGPRKYGKILFKEEWINLKGVEPTQYHLEQGLILFKKSIIIMIIFLISYNFLIGNFHD